MCTAGSKLMKTTAAHPLDPLTSSEIVECASICRAYAEEKDLGEIRFNTITLRVKARVFHSIGAALPQAYCVSLSVRACAPPEHRFIGQNGTRKADK